MTEQKLSRRELQTLFYPGRKLRLIACLVPMKEPQDRTVKAQKSFGYLMTKPDGRESRLAFETGEQIFGVSDVLGNGYTGVKIVSADGEVAAHYELL